MKLQDTGQMMDGVKDEEKRLTEKFSFEEIFHQNENRIHYQMHRLGLQDPYREFYTEGLFAMWLAYKKYNPDKGPLATYFNYAIRNRLIDMIRKKVRDEEKDEKLVEQGKQLKGGEADSSVFTSVAVEETGRELEEEEMWRHVRKELTDKQWVWVHDYIVLGMSQKEIAEKHGVTVEAVKGWAKEARRKLRQVW